MNNNKWLSIPEDLSIYISQQGLKHTWFKFPNGYGASIIPGFFANKYEIAVLDSEGELDYSTPITSDVVPCVDHAKAIEVLYAIKDL
jgi:hypothetical protein